MQHFQGDAFVRFSLVNPGSAVCGRLRRLNSFMEYLPYWGTFLSAYAIISRSGGGQEMRAYIQELQYPHGLMLTGVFVVMAGFVDFTFRKNKGRDPAHPG